MKLRPIRRPENLRHQETSPQARGSRRVASPKPCLDAGSWEPEPNPSRVGPTSSHDEASAAIRLRGTFLPQTVSLNAARTASIKSSR